MISAPYDLSVFLPIPLIGWELFHRLIHCPVFLFSLPINGLEGFSPATWSFETYQLPYGARMFSVAPRFSSSVSLIGLGGFSPGFYSSLQHFHAQRSSHPKTEAIVITWPSEPERKASKADITWQQSSRLHLGQLGLHYNASPSRAPIWSQGYFLFYALDHLLNSSLSTQSESISGCGNYLCFPHLSRKWGYPFLSIIGWRRVWAVGWTQSSLLLPCANVSLVWWQGLTFSLVLVRVAG